MKRVVGLGAGGHGKVVIEMLFEIGGYEIVGLLDPRPELCGKNVLGIPVLGDDSLLPQLTEAGTNLAFIGVGSTGHGQRRADIYRRVRQAGMELLTVIHPAACVSSSVTLGEGVTVMAGAIINAETRIGCNAIVNTGAIVEHECVLGHHAHVAPRAVLGGGVAMGELAHVGMGATILQGVRIGARAIVGAGAVVTRDVADDAVVAGIPARNLHGRGL